MFLQHSDLVRACLVGLKPLRGNEQVSKARGWGWLAFPAAADGEPPTTRRPGRPCFCTPEQSGLLRFGSTLKLELHRASARYQETNFVIDMICPTEDISAS